MKKNEKNIMNQLEFWTTYYNLKEDILKTLNRKSLSHYDITEFMSSITNKKGEVNLTQEKLNKFISENTKNHRRQRQIEDYVLDAFEFKNDYDYLEKYVLSQILCEFYPFQEEVESIVNKLLLHKEEGKMLERFKEIIKKELKVYAQA